MNENNIKNSLDKIEPQKNLKEKMYQNILNKSELQQKNNKKIPMKIINTAIPAAACLAVFLGGIVHFNSQKPPVSDSENSLVQAVSPFENVENASAFEEIGVYIDAPENAENVTYSIIDSNIASIYFTINGHNYELRASEQAGDFSGISGEIISAEQLDSKTNAVLYKIDCAPDLYWKAAWTDGKINYFLCENGAAIYQEIKEITMQIISQMQ